MDAYVVMIMWCVVTSVVYVCGVCCKRCACVVGVVKGVCRRPELIIPVSELESDERSPQHSTSDSHKAAMSHVAETTRPLIIISVFWPDYSRIMCNLGKSLLFCKLCAHN